LAVLHEARREGPEAAARLYGTAAHQDAILEDRDASGDDPRVLIMDRSAGRADKPRQVVPRRDLEFDLLAAIRAEIHRSPGAGRGNRTPTVLPPADFESQKTPRRYPNTRTSA